MSLDPISAGLGIASSLAQGIGGLVMAGKMRKEASKINPIYEQFQKSPYAKQMLGMAQNNLYANSPYRSAGYDRMARGNAARYKLLGSLSPDQQLQGLNNMQDKDNESLFAQGAQDANDFTQRRSEVYNALNANTAENDKAYNNMFQKYQMDMDRKMSLQNAARQTTMGAFGAFGNAASSAMYMNKLGMFGQKSGSVDQPGSGGDTPPWNMSWLHPTSPSTGLASSVAGLENKMDTSLLRRRPW
jgi:hypothetical protein